MASSDSRMSGFPYFAQHRTRKCGQGAGCPPSAPATAGCGSAPRSPVEQVVPEPARRDIPLEIPGGRRHEAHVDLAGFPFAEAPDLPVLEETQELRLERQRELTDLVEEEGSRPASSIRPTRSALASVNAPLRCPNSSLSRRFSGIAPQFTATNGFPRRRPPKWRRRATSSLPVPLSP